MTMKTRPLLDILTEGLTLPDGCDAWGMRAVRPDFRSSRGFRWPWPGGVALAPGPIQPDNRGACPAAEGDGLCTALTAEGMASGGIPAITVLITAHASADVLGADAGKARLRSCCVVEVLDLPALSRAGALHDADLWCANLGGANLRGANLGGADLLGANLGGANLRDADLRDANLSGANLSGANLRGANLRGANLRYADLGGADLRGANLEDADHDALTAWPDGFDPAAAGVRS